MGKPVKYVRDWAEVDLCEMHWAIVLVDHGHALLRKDHAIALKDQCDYLVLHDTEPENEKIYGYREVWEHFKHRRDFTTLHPHTSILSNTHTLDWL